MDCRTAAARVLGGLGLSVSAIGPVVAQEPRQVVSAFLAPEGLPVAAVEPFEAAVAFQTMDRFLDLLVLLSFVLAAYLVGRALQRTVLPSLRPSVFASTVLAIPMLFGMNMDFYDIHRVSVDAAGITTHRYMSADQRVAWSEVARVEVVDGSLFPVVTDDRALRFVGAGDAVCDVPRYLSQADAIAAYGLARLDPGPAQAAPRDAAPESGP